jgi:hypothetical protein
MQPLGFQSTMQTYNPHEGEPREYNNPQILHHRAHMNYHYKPSSNSCINKYFRSLIVQRKIDDSFNNDTRYHDETRTLLAGDVSHSTDQPAGRVYGHVKLATMSSEVSPKNKATIKAKYTNTQQGLPD